MTDLFDTARSELKARLDLLEDQIFVAKRNARDMEADAAMLRAEIAGMDKALELLGAASAPVAEPETERAPRRKIGDEITKLLGLRGSLRVEEIAKALGIRTLQANAALDRLVADGIVAEGAPLTGIYGTGLWSLKEKQEAVDAA